eukprot:scaffold1290_cov115-Isochrysis_galbana.AAC.9
MTAASEREADTFSIPPDTPSSTFRYATAWPDSHLALSSPKAVEPRSPYSSPDQEHSTIDLRGTHPARRSAPSPRASSSIAAVPEFGSTAPKTHASRWLPRSTGRSAGVPASRPGRCAMTFQMGVARDSLLCTTSRAACADGPSRYPPGSDRPPWKPAGAAGEAPMLARRG